MNKRAVVIVAAEAGEDLLAALKSQSEGKDSAVVGEVLGDTRNRVSVKTAFGGSRVLLGTAELMLPRIC